MNRSMRTEKELTTETENYFGSKCFVVDYGLDPVNPHSLDRLIVIDEVPGKVAQFFGKKTVRRSFIGRINWSEILPDRRIPCPKKMELALSDICKRLEKKNKKVIKARRIKASSRA